MRTITAIAAVAALSLGCGSKDAPDNTRADASAAPATTASSAPAQPASKPASEAPAGRAAPPTSVDYAALLPARAAALPVALATLKMTQTKAGVAAALGAALGADGRVNTPGLGGVPTQLGFYAEGEGLRYVQLTLPPDAGDALAKRWGVGVEAEVGRKRMGTWWLDAAAGVQAVLEKRGDKRSILTYWPLLGWQQHLGTRRGYLGYERPDQPVLGATATRILSAYQALGARRTAPDRIDLYLPPHERRARATHVRITLKDDVAVSQVIRFVFGADQGMKQAMHAGVHALYGKPAKTERGTDKWEGAVGVSMRVSVARGQYVLTFTAPGR